jgi:two-component system NarL family sensor kinase
MRAGRGHPAFRASPGRELAKVRGRLAEAEETLRAIRAGEVDTLVVAGRQGSQVFTLKGAEHAYRLLIESMNEGALTLTADKTILYANQCFANMVKCPLEHRDGQFLSPFLSVKDQAALRALLKQEPAVRAPKSRCCCMPAMVRKCRCKSPFVRLAKNGFNQATIGMVVTDMTEARRSEELLRALTHRVVQVQEAERGRVALELHDTITQMLCAVLVPQPDAGGQTSGAQPAGETGGEKTPRNCSGRTAEEVERISRNLRPSVLDHLGLVAGCTTPARSSQNRTGVSVKLVCVKLTVRLPADTEVGALPHSSGNLAKRGEARPRPPRDGAPDASRTAFVQLTIHDDGIGFDPDHHPARRKGKGGFGLLGMRGAGGKDRGMWEGQGIPPPSSRGAPGGRSGAFPRPGPCSGA